jgi:hypothetical protein
MRRTGMASILLRVPIDAGEEAIHWAVATSEGVNAWWSNHTEGPDGAGSTMKVSFPDAPTTFDFTVNEDVPGKRVSWNCVSGPPEWIGTGLSFDIERDADGNRSVLFTHSGWKTTEESCALKADTWAPIHPPRE